MRLMRLSNEPILTPRKDVRWEKDAVFNAAAVHADGAFHLLYRAVEHPDGLGGVNSNRSSIGYARSEDGIHFERLPEPVLTYGPEHETYGVEDPRVTRLEDAWYMLYTAFDGRIAQVAMARSDDLIHWQRMGLTIPESLFHCWNKDAALFPERIGGRYAVIHRPDPDMCLSVSDDLYGWTDHHFIVGPRPGTWESLKIGLGAPPIKTEAGWLVVTHGVSHELVYCLGVVLLDLEEPWKVVYRREEPILEPELDWELHGDIANVVFACGAVLLGSELWVYYGGADSVIGLATGDIRGLLRAATGGA